MRETKSTEPKSTKPDGVNRKWRQSWQVVQEVSKLMENTFGWFKKISPFVHVTNEWPIFGHGTFGFATFGFTPKKFYEFFIIRIEYLTMHET